MGKGDTETKTTNTPYFDRELKEAVRRAEGLSDTPMEFFPGSRVGPRDALSLQASEMTGGLGSSDYRKAAEGFLGQQLRGDFMPGANPYLDEISKIIGERTTDAYKRGTAATTASRYAGAGRVGSPAYQKAVDQNELNLGEALYRGNTELYYGDYRNAMSDRMRALGLTPSVQNLEYADIGQLRGQGAINEQWSQRYLDDEVARFSFNQIEEEERLDRLFARLGQTSQYGTSTSLTKGPNTAGASIGLGVLGLAGTLGGAALMGPLGAGLMGTDMGTAG